MSVLKFLAITLLFVILGSLQGTSLLSIAGVKPNILLMCLIALAFFLDDIWLYGFFLLLAVSLLKVQGFFVPELLAFTLVAIAAVWIANVWHALPVLNNFMLAIGGTLFFYIISGPSYLVAHPGLTIIELGYNAAVGFLLYQTFDLLCLKENSMLRT